jgi:predicted metalloendopeptidase
LSWFSVIYFYNGQIDQPELGLPDRDYFLKGREDRKLVAYEKYATKMAVIFGADSEVAARDIKAVIDFEIEIANVRNTQSTACKLVHLMHKLSVYERKPLSLTSLWGGLFLDLIE